MGLQGAGAHGRAQGAPEATQLPQAEEVRVCVLIYVSTDPTSGSVVR